MRDLEGLSATVRELYGIVARLERDYEEWGRHFTLDGHLVGSMGEVYAAERYGLELFTSSEERHDGRTPDGRLVQVKATQRGSIAISSEPDYLVVLRISEEGAFEEVYNGPGAPVWDLVRGKRRPKNGQYQIALSRLRVLNERVPAGERIAAHLP